MNSVFRLLALIRELRVNGHGLATPCHALQAVLHPHVLFVRVGTFATRRRRRRSAPITTTAVAPAMGRYQPVARAPNPAIPSQAKRGVARGMVAQQAAQATAAKAPAVPAAAAAREGVGL